MYKIIITCPSQEVLTQPWQNLKVHIDHEPHIDYEQLSQRIADYDAMVISTSVLIDKPLLQKAHKLKVIGRLGSGLDHIDLSYAASEGIKIISTPEANSRAVAEHVLAMMLSYHNNICKAQREVKSGNWLRNPNMGTQLHDKHIGIIGYGHNGSLTAQLLHAIGMQVKVYDPYVTYPQSSQIRFVDTMQELMTDIDFLSFHVPLTDETYHYFSRDIIKKATKPLVLINISRGEVVDTEALLEALDQEKILAALLDVIEDEKTQIENEVWVPKNEAQIKLREHPKALITPHIAGYSYEAKTAMNQILGRKMADFLGGL